MSRAYEKCIQLLKVRAHHSAELTKKLSMRGFDRAEIEAAIQKLLQLKLLDNEQFAQNYLDELVRYKTFGYFGLKAKLMQRGISGTEAEEILSSRFTPKLEAELAQKVIDRSGKLDRIKLAQKLQRKGFRSEVIRAILKNIS